MDFQGCYTLTQFAVMLERHLENNDMDASQWHDAMSNMSVAMRKTDLYNCYAVQIDYGEGILTGVPAGWDVVATRRRSDRPEETFLFVVLCRHRDRDKDEKWAVWSLNTSCSSFNAGMYYDNFPDAFLAWRTLFDFSIKGERLDLELDKLKKGTTP